MAFEGRERAEEGGQIAALYQLAEELLHGLDETELHQAAAYVAMAVDVMRRNHPELLKSG